MLEEADKASGKNKTGQVKEDASAQQQRIDFSALAGGMLSQLEEPFPTIVIGAAEEPA